ncbi:Outer membrane protein transport protein (OMPP1/FadL/TodX) [Algibacter lectus]|uniref:OmpP1/FadL family transporter n=1 Tax=Algibacter lectus TaxID=221126 RepID=UPI0008E34B7D|nr:outer membrane protein transport protein [Algibacter lectus]SFD22216.1 Outer membrane protein transport protein (OMPP1/FadL/TodX) [Algibacter lectus]
MKKLSLLFIGVFSMSNIYAQDISDALRYSQDEIQGSARFRALSGAFGALGGDLSAVSINPAGSAVFSQSHASFSLISADKNNTANYFGNIEKTNDSKLDLNQGGAAFVFKSNNNSPWRKFTLAIAYDRTNDHNNSWYAEGIGNTSIDQYFLDYTRNTVIPFGVLKLQGDEFIENAYADIGAIPEVGFKYQQAFLGYWGGIIDPLNTDDTTNNDNIDYVSILSGSPYNQTYSKISTGYNGKISFNFATQYEDNLYLGINLNSHFIDYQQSNFFTENNDVEFENNLATTGNGFSFQLGAILKITPELRMGLAYDSPTWYTIQEEASQSIYSLEADDEIGFISNIINIYPEYKLQTPGEFTGSIAYIFGQQGLISFDYSNKNYANTTFKPEVDYTDLNADITNVLTSASTYRFGGEYKVKQLSFRGGYRFEESPYTDGVTVGDLNGFSLGLGYNFGNTKLDLTFDQAKRSYQTSLYNVGLIDTVDIDRVNSNVTLSLSFNI